MVFRKLSSKSLYQFDIETTTFSLGSYTLKIQISSNRWIEDGRKLPFLPEINLKFWRYSRGQAVSWDDRDGILHNFQNEILSQWWPQVRLFNEGAAWDGGFLWITGITIGQRCMGGATPPGICFLVYTHWIPPVIERGWLGKSRMNGCKSWIFHCLVWDTRGYTMVYQLVPGGRITSGPIIVPAEFKNMHVRASKGAVAGMGQGRPARSILSVNKPNCMQLHAP